MLTTADARPDAFGHPCAGDEKADARADLYELARLDPEPACIGGRDLAIWLRLRVCGRIEHDSQPLKPCTDRRANLGTVFADAIREGESIAAPLKRSGQFPPLVFHMIAIGEKSGQLEEMLQNVAKSYEAQVEMRIGALTSLLEPVMIVAMGGGVAFIVFSILMPIMQLNTFVAR